MVLIMSLQVARLVVVIVQTLTEGGVTSALNIIVCTHNLFNVRNTTSVIATRFTDKMGLSGV